MAEYGMLAPREERVLIQGKEYVIRKLGLGQVLRLSHFMAKVQKGLLVEMQAKLEEGADPLILLIGALSGTEFSDLLQILVDAPSLEDRALLAKANAEEVSDLVVALTEVNDFQKLLRNFQKATESLRAAIPGPLSPSSSRA